MHAGFQVGMPVLPPDVSICMMVVSEKLHMSIPCIWRSGVDKVVYAVRRKCEVEEVLIKLHNQFAEM